MRRTISSTIHRRTFALRANAPTFRRRGDGGHVIVLRERLTDFWAAASVQAGPLFPVA